MAILSKNFFVCFVLFSLGASAIPAFYVDAEVSSQSAESRSAEHVVSLAQHLTNTYTKGLRLLGNSMRMRATSGLVNGGGGLPAAVATASPNTWHSLWCFIKGLVGFDCIEPVHDIVVAPTPIVPIVHTETAQIPLTPETPTLLPFAPALTPSVSSTTSSFPPAPPHRITVVKTVAITPPHIDKFAPLSSLIALMDRVGVLEKGIPRQGGADAEARKSLLILENRLNALQASTYNSIPNVSYAPAAMMGADGNAVMFGISGPSGHFTGDVSALTGTFTSSVNGGSLSTPGTITVGGAATLAGSLAAGNTLYVDAVNGRVGIGTSSPTDTLSLAGSLYFAPTTPTQTASRLYNSGGDLYWGGSLIGGATTGNWATDGTNAWRTTGNVGIGTSSPYAKLSIQATTGGTDPLFTIASSTNGLATSTAFTVLANGNVGIGTTTPNAFNYPAGSKVLSISNNGSARSVLELNGNVGASATVGSLGFGNAGTQIAGIDARTDGALNTGALVFHAYGTGGSERMRIVSTGNVGIGTTSPSDMLSIGGASGTIGLNFRGDNLACNSLPCIRSGGSQSIVMSPGNSQFVYLNWDGGISGGVKFGNGAASEVMRVQANGNVGIGTTSPYAKLSVVGPVVAESFSATSTTATSTFMGAVGIGTTTPTAKLSIQGLNSNAVLGSELLSTAADRDFSSNSGNWSGTNWTIATGVSTHTAGANTFTHTLAAVAGNTYQIVFTVNTTATGTLQATFGGGISGDSGALIGQVVGTVVTETLVVTAVNTGQLTFTPDANWSGTLDNISVKQIIFSGVAQNIFNSDGSLGFEIRSNTGIGGDSDSGSVFIGKDVGRANTVSGGNNGTGNTAVGNKALANNTIGSGNNAFGNRALWSNTTGTRNTAIGFQTMSNNTSGVNNGGFGTYALYYNTTGSNNTAVGNSALQNNVSGAFNSAIGYVAGYGAGGNNVSTVDNYMTFLGFAASRDASVLTTTALTNGTAIGKNARVGASNTIVLGGTGADAVNVGIGTTSPYAKLSVVGPVVAESFNATSTTATSTFMGAVGIGTTTSAVPLTIQNNASSLTYGALLVDNNATAWNSINLTNDLGYKSLVATVGSNYATANIRNRTVLYGDGDGVDIIANSFADPTPPNIRFFTNGFSSSAIFERMRIDNAGNVGIGTTSPYSKLSVWGSNTGATSIFELTNSASTSLMKVLNNGNVQIGTSTSLGVLSVESSVLNIPSISVSNNAPTGYTQIRFGGTGGSFQTGVGNASETLFGVANKYYIFDSRNVVQAMRLVIDAAGNVGIGTTSPYARLSVVGPVVAESFSATSTTATSTFMGAVGIGTTAPGVPLEVAGDFGAASASVFKLNNNNATNPSNYTFSFGGISNKQLLVSSGGSAIAAVAFGTTLFVGLGTYSNANVGIGTTSPYAKLSVVGPVVAESFSATSTTATSTFMGAVGVGTSSPAKMLDVAGTIRQSNAVNCGLTTNASGDIACVSDEQLKDVHGNYAGGLTELFAISPVVFNYKNEHYTHIGFSAQNVQGVLPEATPLQGSGFLGLDANAITALSVNAIKEVGRLLTGPDGQLIDVSSITALSTIENETHRSAFSFITGFVQGSVKIAEDFVVARVTAIRGYFDEVFARKVHGGELCASKSDGTEVCVTGDQLANMINSMPASAVGVGGSTGDVIANPSAPTSTPEIVMPLEQIETSTSSITSDVIGANATSS